MWGERVLCEGEAITPGCGVGCEECSVWVSPYPRPCSNPFSVLRFQRLHEWDNKFL